MSSRSIPRGSPRQKQEPGGPTPVRYQPEKGEPDEDWYCGQVLPLFQRSFNSRLINTVRRLKINL
jgi:hypothetical protein